MPAVAPFNVSTDATSLAQEWDKWLQRFRYYITATGADTAKQKRALLLHMAGSDVQDVFATLPDTGDDDDYNTAVEKLTSYYKPKKNVPFLRHVFRQAVQEESETVDTFVTRLKTLSKNCEYGDMLAEMIRDQVVDKCRSQRLRRRLLREENLTLEIIQSLARAMEAADTQAQQIEAKSTPHQTQMVQAVSTKKRYPSQPRPPDDSQGKPGARVCYRCGKPGHLARECRCSKGHICEKCGIEGHFAVVCRTKSKNSKPAKDTSKASQMTVLKRTRNVFTVPNHRKVNHQTIFIV